MTTIESRFSNRVLQAFSAPGLPIVLDVKAATATDPAEILLYDEIGTFGVTAKAFNAALKTAGNGPLTVRVNSPGGDIHDGLCIFNSLKSRKAPVTVVVDGLAASAASVIAMAGSPLKMHEASQLMIHSAWCLALGNKQVMTAMADTLGKVDGQLAQIYSQKTGSPVADMAAVMDAETWLTADEAHAQGFCDHVIVPPQQPKAATETAVQAAVDPDKTDEAISTIIQGMERLRDAVAILAEAEPVDPVARDQKELRLRRLRVKTS